LSGPDALDVAAASVEDPAMSLVAVDFGTAPTGEFTFSAISALALVGLFAGLAQTMLALGAGVVALQGERQDADSALLVAGMRRSELARVRVLELGVTALPGPMAAAMLSILLAVAFEHYDDLALPYVLARFAPLAAGPLVVVAALAAIVTMATPAVASAVARRE
jgi:hypothetical protein